jgi:hypothetical protein
LLDFEQFAELFRSSPQSENKSDSLIVCALHHRLNGKVCRANDQNIFNGGCHLSSFL